VKDYPHQLTACAVCYALPTRSLKGANLPIFLIVRFPVLLGNSHCSQCCSIFDGCSVLPIPAVFPALL